jgi:hypothetical protein
MAYVYTGYKRSLSVSVTKKINNITQSGYPKTYPTALDIANGYFTYNAVQYDIPTDDELAKLDTATYNALLAAFEAYVESIETGLDFNTDTLVDPVVADEDTCPSGTPEVTTTTTTEAVCETYCVVGLYAPDDPAHPGGGVVVYINCLGVEDTVAGIWNDATTTFDAQSIVDYFHTEVPAICPVTTTTTTSA